MTAELASESTGRDRTRLAGVLTGTGITAAPAPSNGHLSATAG